MSTDLLLHFPLGRFHANPWGRHVNEGEVEWPPSPWRLLRGLVSVWHERAPDLDRAVVEAMLGKLCDPPTYLLPDAHRTTTRHWYPDGRRATGTGWAEGTDKALDAFVVLAPGQPVVVRWSVDLPAPEREVLRTLAALLPYVGRADSVCEARLLEEQPAGQGRWLSPLADEGALDLDVVDLLVPRRPLDLDGLSARTRDLRRGGQLEPPAARRVPYPKPAAPARAEPRRRPAARVQSMIFALDAPALPSGRLAVLVADALRAAAQAQYGVQGGVPAEISGHQADKRPAVGHRHAHWWVLPDTGAAADLCNRAVLYAEDGIAAEDVDRLRHIHTLYDRQGRFRRLRVAPGATGRLADLVPDLVAARGGVRTWHSVTPYAPPRHQDRRLPWAEQIATALREEARLRGLPDLDDVRLLPGAWLDVTRHRLRERARDDRRSSGVEVTFTEPLPGPLSLGALSHFGLGLFRPGAARNLVVQGLT